jgi:hypothetical protein
MLRLMCVLLAAGCSSGLDDLLLSGGARPRPDLAGGKADDPSEPTPDLSIPHPPTMMPSPTPSQCGFLDGDLVGQTPAGWLEDKGSWVVKENAGSRTVQQLTAPGNNGDDFSLSYGDRGWTDLTIRAHVISIGKGSEDCVVARYNGPGSGYALCVEIDTYASPPVNRWELMLLLPGRNNDQRLVQKDFGTIALEHDLSLQVVGASLIAIVDGVAQPAITSGALPAGAAALSTELAGSQFGALCLVRP